VREQLASKAALPPRGTNIQIFEIESGLGQKCGEAEEVHRKSDRLIARVPNHGVRHPVRSEETGIELGLRGGHLMSELLVLGELLDELQHEWKIMLGRWLDTEVGGHTVAGS
jgi:hypothetical protein